MSFGDGSPEFQAAAAAFRSCWLGCWHSSSFGPVLDLSRSTSYRAQFRSLWNISSELPSERMMRTSRYLTVSCVSPLARDILAQLSKCLAWSLSYRSGATPRLRSETPALHRTSKPSRHSQFISTHCRWSHSHAAIACSPHHSRSREFARRRRLAYRKLFQFKAEHKSQCRMCIPLWPFSRDHCYFCKVIFVE